MSGSRIQIAEDDELKVPLLKLDTETSIIAARKRQEELVLQAAAQRIKALEKIIFQMSSFLQYQSANILKATRRIYAFLLFLISAMIIGDVFAFRNADAADREYYDLNEQAILFQNQRIEDFFASNVPNSTVSCGSLYNGTLNQYINGVGYSLAYSLDQRCGDLHDWWMDNYSSDYFGGKTCTDMPTDMLCKTLLFCSDLVENVCADYADIPDNYVLPIILAMLTGAIGTLAITAALFKDKTKDFVKNNLTNISSKELDFAYNILTSNDRDSEDPAVLLKAADKDLIATVNSEAGKKLSRLAFLTGLMTDSHLQVLRKSPIADYEMLREIFAYAGILSTAQQREERIADRRRDYQLRYNSIFRQPRPMQLAITVDHSYTPPEFKP